MYILSGVYITAVYTMSRRRWDQNTTQVDNRLDWAGATYVRLLHISSMGLSLDGGWANFSKKAAETFPLRKAHRISLLSAWSISLDSTFKEDRKLRRGQQGPDWNRKRDDNKILLMTGNGRITNFYDKEVTKTSGCKAQEGSKWSGNDRKLKDNRSQRTETGGYNY